MAEDRPKAPQAGEKYIVRFPAGMREEIANAAKASNRSMNAEIIERLDKTFDGDEDMQLMRSNTVLLRTLVDFILLRHDHPEAMAPLDEPILRMARSIKEAATDASIMKNARPAFVEYVEGFVDAVNRATTLLGPGWAAKGKPPAAESTGTPDKASTKPKP